MTQVIDISSRAGTAKALIRDDQEYIQNWWLTKREFFERRLLEYIYWHYKGGVFVDVGSNIGNHTLFFAKFCQPSHVISIEPQADVMAFQTALLDFNGLKNRISFRQYAASNFVGYGHIESWEPKPTFEWSGGQLNKLGRGKKAEVATLDMLLDGIPNLKLIKIDVEMKEMDVLEGAAGTLTKQKPALFIEIRNRPNYQRVKQYLSQFGYRQVGSHFQEGQVFEFTVHADETEISRLA